MDVKFRIGVMPGPWAAGPEGADLFWKLLDLCERTEIDSVWFSDRLSSPLPVLEPITTMAAVAARTRRLKFGPSALIAPFRPPVLAARQLAMLDYLPGGRREEVRLRRRGRARGAGRPLRRARHLLARRQSRAGARGRRALHPARPRGRRDARGVHRVRTRGGRARAPGAVRRGRRVEVRPAADGTARADARAARAPGRRGDPALPPPLSEPHRARLPPYFARRISISSSGSTLPPESTTPTRAPRASGTFPWG